MNAEHENIEVIRQILKQLFSLKPEPKGIGSIIRQTLFYLYEGGEKCKWCSERPHSKAARALRKNLPKVKDWKPKVTYDHAIPLNLLKEGLKGATGSRQQLHNFLSQHVQGVVILREEDKDLTDHKLHRKLPAGARASDLFARYREAEIEFDRDDEKLLNKLAN